jgi:hypothetical protein
MVFTLRAERHPRTIACNGASPVFESGGQRVGFVQSPQRCFGEGGARVPISARAVFIPARKAGSGILVCDKGAPSSPQTL